MLKTLKKIYKDGTLIQSETEEVIHPDIMFLTEKKLVTVQILVQDEQGNLVDGLEFERKQFKV
jgi:hypothetical protein